MPENQIKITLPKRLIDKLRHCSIHNTKEWQFRFRQAGYRILLSLLFYVSSKRGIERKEVILPGIGIYYSFFHLGLGLMSVYPHIDIKNIPNFPLDKFRQKAYGFTEIYYLPKEETKHSKVENFIKRLSDSKILSRDFYYHFKDVKLIRMILNYRPPYFGYNRFYEKLSEIIENSEQYIQEGCLVIKKLNEEFWNVLSKKSSAHVHDYLPAFIGDGIMDDFLENYANEEEENMVTHLLLKYELTT